MEVSTLEWPQKPNADISRTIFTLIFSPDNQIKASNIHINIPTSWLFLYIWCVKLVVEVAIRSVMLSVLLLYVMDLLFFLDTFFRGKASSVYLWENNNLGEVMTTEPMNINPLNSDEYGYPTLGPFQQCPCQFPTQNHYTDNQSHQCTPLCYLRQHSELLSRISISASFRQVRKCLWKPWHFSQP